MTVSPIVTRGYIFTIALVVTAGYEIGAAVTPTTVDIPGLEYTSAPNRLHYVSSVNRIHYTTRDEDR